MEEMTMILQKSPSKMDKLMNKAKKGMRGLEKLIPKNCLDNEVSGMQLCFAWHVV